MGNYGLVRDVSNYNESVLSLQSVTIKRPWLPRSLAWRSYNARLLSQNFVYPPVTDLALAVNVFFGGPHCSITVEG